MMKPDENDPLLCIEDFTIKLTTGEKQPEKEILYLENPRTSLPPNTRCSRETKFTLQKPYSDTQSK